MLSAATFLEIVEDLQFQNWNFLTGDMGEGFYLQVQFEAPDVDADIRSFETVTQRGRKWYISRHMTRGEVIQTAFLAIKTAQEHELREQFTYQGRAIFGPHFSVDALLYACDEGHVEKREPIENPETSLDFVPHNPRRDDPTMCRCGANKEDDICLCDSC